MVSSPDSNSDITFVIITQNEELRIERAIKSCSGLGQILVVDGGSTDSTVDLAIELGARVIRNPFQYAAQQYNFGLTAVTTSWAFILDSDERIGDMLRESLLRFSPPSHVAGYWIDRQNYFVGRPIRHSGWSPDMNVRLLRVGQSHYDDRPVHARVVTDGNLDRLAGQIHHLTYANVAQYIAKLNRLTSREVEARAQVQRALDARSRMRLIYLRLPFKSAVRFFYMYVLRRGFLDGRAGFDLARLSAFYEIVVASKKRYDVNSVGSDELEIYG